MCVCVGEIISLPWFSKELKYNLSKNNCLCGSILILLVHKLDVVSLFCIFCFCFFIQVFSSFIVRIDSLATRETIVAVLFCLFSSFYCLLSHIYIWIALPSWFYLVWVSVEQEMQEDETRGVSV